MKEAELDWHICSRARLSRDARFDGKFFIGVNGSGVYCRPICPAPTAKEKNCRYFATAAGAAEAGYRPCLRCRPECAPGTPAWLGTSATVARALRLIEERGLDDDGIEGLAERLGVGARHLRRLFLKHLGASPSAVAQTRRAHFAKKLIDETRLSMTQIAIAAGFGSVRRFNAAISRTYRRTPTQIRATARGSKPSPQDEYVFVLRFRPPFAWQELLAVLRRTAIPGVEAVGGNDYRRAISLNGGRGHIHVSLDEKQPALRARISFGDPRGLFQIVERIRRMFDLNADWATIVQTLGSDPLLSPRLRAVPGLRVPGCWDGFELAVQTLVTANANGKGAAALAQLVQKHGKSLRGGEGLTHLFPDAQTLTTADLSACGIGGNRARAIRALAEAVSDGSISFDTGVDVAPLLAQLRRLTGLRESAAEYIGMRALREPDAFPAFAQNLPGGFESLAALKRRAEGWRPWRAYAAIYLSLDPENAQPLRNSRDWQARERPRPDQRSYLSFSNA